MKIPVTTLPPDQRDQAEPKPTEGPTSQVLGDICQACGLCCAGVLFTDVSLEASEAQTLEALKPVQAEAVAVQSGEGPEAEYGMDQPCQFLCGTACSIYQDRPNKCRAFECNLLEKVQKQHMTVEDALALVAVAKKHVQNMQNSMPSWMYVDDCEADAVARQGVAQQGLRAQLYAVKKALIARHKHFTQLGDQQALAEDHRFTYQVLNYLRFMAEYFHESSLLRTFEKLLQAQTFIAPPATATASTDQSRGE